jgi:hypothetical protein
VTSSVSGSKPRIKRREDDNTRQQKTRQGKRREEKTHQTKAREDITVMLCNVWHGSPRKRQMVLGLFRVYYWVGVLTKQDEKITRQRRDKITRQDHITKQRQFIREHKLARQDNTTREDKARQGTHKTTQDITRDKRMHHKTRQYTYIHICHKTKDHIHGICLVKQDTKLSQDKTLPQQRSRQDETM